MKNTTAIGNVTEGVVLAALLRKGFTVLVPFGAQQAYDLVIQEGAQFKTVQCKTGRIKNGAVAVRICTVVRDNVAKKYVSRGYGEAVDYFGVYCPDNNEVYLVPRVDVGETEARLRLEPSKNGQVVATRFAAQYKI